MHDGAPPVELDPDAIRQLAEYLGIRRNIRIRWMREPDPRHPTAVGLHRMRPDEHLIQLDPNRSSEAISRTLAHELRHAYDAECYGDDDWWPTYESRRDYFERLARDFAERFSRRSLVRTDARG